MPKPRTVAEELKINGSTTRVYHQLADSPFENELAHPGFIVAIEKSPKRLVEARHPDDPYSDYVIPPPRDSGEQLNRYNKYTKPAIRALFVTHIAQYNLLSLPDSEEQRFLYNIFLPDAGTHTNQVLTQPPIQLGEYETRGWEALKNKLKVALRNEIDKAIADQRPYTHLIIASMGWNNDQVESIQHYNALIGNLIASAHRAGDNRFRPLLHGLTWPSVWGDALPKPFWVIQYLFHFISYFDKANDADAIGMTFANWLVNDLGADVKTRAKDAKKPIKIITKKTVYF